MVSCRVDAGFFSATSSRRLPVKLAAPFWGGSFSETPKHFKKSPLLSPICLGKVLVSQKKHGEFDRVKAREGRRFRWPLAFEWAYKPGF